MSVKPGSKQFLSEFPAQVIDGGSSSSSADVPVEFASKQLAAEGNRVGPTRQLLVQNAISDLKSHKRSEVRAATERIAKYLDNVVNCVRLWEASATLINRPSRVIVLGAKIVSYNNRAPDEDKIVKKLGKEEFAKANYSVEAVVRGFGKNLNKIKSRRGNKTGIIEAGDICITAPEWGFLVQGLGLNDKLSTVAQIDNGSYITGYATRSMVISLFHYYLNANNLRDPKNGQVIIPDAVIQQLMNSNVMSQPMDNLPSKKGNDSMIVYGQQGVTPLTILLQRQTARADYNKLFNMLEYISAAKLMTQDELFEIKALTKSDPEVARQALVQYDAAYRSALEQLDDYTKGEIKMKQDGRMIKQDADGNVISFPYTAAVTIISLTIITASAIRGKRFGNETAASTAPAFDRILADAETQLDKLSLEEQTIADLRSAYDADNAGAKKEREKARREEKKLHKPNTKSLGPKFRTKAKVRASASNTNA